MYSQDGGFLSWFWRENLIVAVAKDANDELQLLAFMVCHGESKETYSAFISYMKEDFADIQRCLVMADQDKGGDAALQEHDMRVAFCTRHMKKNLVLSSKLKVTDDVAKLLGLLSKAANKDDYDVHLKDLQQLGKQGKRAAKWLDDRSAVFATHRMANDNVSNYKDVTSNNAESMMNALKIPRETPVLSLIQKLLEWICDRNLRAHQRSTSALRALSLGPEVNPGVDALSPAAMERLQDTIKRAKSHCSVVAEQCTDTLLQGVVARDRLRLKSELAGFISEKVKYRVKFEKIDGEWRVICTCAEPKATGSVCVDGVALSLLLPRPKLDPQLKQKLLSELNPRNPFFHDAHFHVSTWALQHEAQQNSPLFNYSLRAELSDVENLLTSEGFLPVAPPPGRGKPGRKRTKRRVKEKRMKPQSETSKRKTRGAQQVEAAGVSLPPAQAQAPPIPPDAEVDIGMQVRLIDLCSGDEEGDGAAPKSGDEEGDGAAPKRKTRRGKRKPCPLCGSEGHTVAGCQLLDTEYVLASLLPQWVKRPQENPPKRRRRKKKSAATSPQPPPIAPSRVAPAVRLQPVDPGFCGICAGTIRASHSKSKCSKCRKEVHFDCLQSSVSRRTRVWTCFGCAAE